MMIYDRKCSSLKYFITLSFHHVNNVKAYVKIAGTFSSAFYLYGANSIDARPCVY